MGAFSCATAPGKGEEAEICRAAQQELAGRVEAVKRQKGKYPDSLEKLPKDMPVPAKVNGYPLEYWRTKKGFRLICRYGPPEDMTTCALNSIGTWNCVHGDQIGD
jgi:hypothetical protein